MIVFKGLGNLANIGALMKQAQEMGGRMQALQEELSGLGYWLGGADGAFGPGTTRAVVALQKANGLGRDGVVGPATRAALDAGHRVRFVYVPKHTSWLNQVEIWFSVLARRVLRRGNFRSVADLREKILAYIGYYNRTRAKPYKWTYTGRPLNV